MKKRDTKNTHGSITVGAAALLLALLMVFSTAAGISGCGMTGLKPDSKGRDSYSVNSIQDSGEAGDGQGVEPMLAGDAEVYFFDVGQGDASLIIEDGKTILIDAGDNGQESFLIDAISSLGITRLDYVVATHNHADHIGGMEEIISFFEIGVFFTTATPATTVTYERMLTALEGKPDVNVVIPRPGDEYKLGESYFIFLGPFNSHLEFEEQNDSSLVLKYINGVHSFLFMGDAEAQTERDLLDSASNVRATVLHVGHHGSSSSSTPDFIEAVGAEYAILSFGEDNQYGHPHRETIEVLADANVLSTAEAGTIVMESSQAGLSIYTEFLLPGAEAEETS